MKDYIYLDEEYLNSALAQYEEGLINSFSKESGTEGKRQESKELSKDSGIDGIVSIGAKYVKGVREQSGVELTESQTRTIDYVLKDYGVDVLIKKIEDFDTKKEGIDTANEGNFILYTSPFQIYDFNLIANISAEKNISLLKKEPTELERKHIKELRTQIALKRKQKNLNREEKQEIKEIEEQIVLITEGGIDFSNLEVITKASTFANEIFDNNIVIKSNQALMICRREKFRMNKSELSFLTQSTRQITILGRVIAIQKETHADGNIDKFEEYDMNRIPSVFHDIFLSNFKMLYPNDRIIKPIALFFE